MTSGPVVGGESLKAAESRFYRPGYLLPPRPPHPCGVPHRVSPPGGPSPRWRPRRGGARDSSTSSSLTRVPSILSQPRAAGTPPAHRGRREVMPLLSSYVGQQFCQGVKLRLTRQSPLRLTRSPAPRCLPSHEVTLQEVAVLLKARPSFTNPALLYALHSLGRIGGTITSPLTRSR